MDTLSRTARPSVAFVVALIVLTTVLSAWRAPNARAAGFVVNSTEDRVDAEPGDGICATFEPGECTLRAAVQETNVLEGPDTIQVPQGTYDLTIAGARESELSETGDLDLLGPVTITGAGAGATIIDGNDLDRVFEVFAVATISDVTVRDGGNVTVGAGINVNAASGELDLARAVVRDNVATHRGGGIFAGGPLSLDEVEIRDNTATASFGGGLYVDLEPAVSVTRTTIAGNYAGTQGGGAWLALTDEPTTTFANVTWSHNSAARDGGAVRLYSGSLTLTNNTIADNEARTAAGAGLSRALGSFRLENTILDNSFGSGADNCQGAAAAYASAGHNLEDGDTCDLSDDPSNPDTTDGDWINTDPGLGPLTDQGGAVRSRPLLGGSEALDAGTNTACPSTDARGAPRPADSGDAGAVATCDIGAYEYVDADKDGVEWGPDPNDGNTCVPHSTDPTCDSDEDNIINADDDCDNSAEDVDGFQDGDGCPDPDNDSDGVLDGQDAAPNNPCVPNDEHGECDFDGDGDKNSVDLDDDDDDQSDVNESRCGSDPYDATDKSADLDADDIPNCVDSDRDGDTVANGEDAFPDDPTESADGDDDGVGDNSDDCVDEAEDPDGFQDDDGCVDEDNDSDGVLDEDDIAPNNACAPDRQHGECDLDNDGEKNSADADDDGDGANDSDDDCPMTAEDEDAVQPTDGCPDEGVKSTVTASYVPSTDKVKGKVTAPAAGCRPDRTVTLFKRRPGPDAAIGTPVTTNARGGYRTPALGTNGTLYVKVTKKTLPPNGNDVVVTCSAAKSPGVETG